MPTVTAKYSVVDGSPVHLKVTIGDAQTGSSAVYLDGNLLDTQPTIDMDLPDGSGARTQPTTRGKPKEHPLRGKVLLVSTLVFDVQQATDRVSVRVDLSGGVPSDFPLVQVATAHGAPVNFLTVVTFV